MSLEVVANAVVVVVNAVVVVVVVFEDRKKLKLISIFSSKLIRLVAAPQLPKKNEKEKHFSRKKPEQR